MGEVDLDGSKTCEKAGKQDANLDDGTEGKAVLVVELARRGEVGHESDRHHRRLAKTGREQHRADDRHEEERVSLTLDGERNHLGAVALERGRGLSAVGACFYHV